MQNPRSVLLFLLAASGANVAACGPAPPPPARAPVEVRVEGARRPAPPPRVVDDPPRARSPGENGPRTPPGILGEAGQLAPDPETTLFVNTREIRAHPWANDIERAITSVLVGWNTFMPHDLVHPIREVDWVLMAGNLVLGHTADNVFLARYTIDEAHADAVSKKLLGRLEQAAALPLQTAGATAITAHVDGADRAYVRAAPHILAIVPSRDAAAVALRLSGATIPEAPRAGELGRLITRARTVRRHLPKSVGEVRVWLSPEGKRVGLHVEAECMTEDGAREAESELQHQLARARRRTFLRMAVGGLLSRARILREGRIVRAHTELEHDEVSRLSKYACAGSGSCEDGN